MDKGAVSIRLPITDKNVVPFFYFRSMNSLTLAWQCSSVTCASACGSRITLYYLTMVTPQTEHRPNFLSNLCNLPTSSSPSILI